MSAHIFRSMYDNIRRQLLSMLRVGALDGGMPHISEEKAVPPSLRLRVARNDELASPYGSSATSGDDDDGALGMLG